MDNKTVENIAAEDKQTRDRRLALRDQKVAIEEAKSLCASLAMRSELRGHDDGDEEDSDEEDSRRYSQQQQQQQLYAPPPPQQQQQYQRAARDSRYEEPHNSPAAAARRPTQEQNHSYRKEPQERTQTPTQNYRQDAVSPASTRHEHGDSSRVSNEWPQNYYTTEAPSGSVPQAPNAPPPPPPRPAKHEYEGEEPRSSRDGKRESARHRIMGSLAK
ncbi:hypothetical protein IMZ48_01940 [Candidatus Bathyarchaeota archaeon]|nr:hypothetical protein [Candidatus Bathyarchaeota archaeon]